MEGANEAMGQVSNEQTQQPTTTIVSTMTTLSQVAPISQNEREEFESDPKWEITTLEKASFDDLYLDASIDNQPQTANGNIPSATQEHMSENAELKRDQKQAKESMATISGNQKPIQQMETTTIVPSNTECFISLHSMMKGTNNEAPSHLNVTQVVHNQQLSNTTVKILESNFQNPETTSTEKLASTFGQDKIVKTVQDASTEQANDTNPNSSAMSQSSVDAQMETVIEHVVELGGGHQFSQTIGHHEDKEKAVESIQREILGCRNPMESLAEVASLQPVLNESVIEGPMQTESIDKIELDETKGMVEELARDDDEGQYDDADFSKASETSMPTESTNTKHTRQASKIGDARQSGHVPASDSKPEMPMEMEKDAVSPKKDQDQRTSASRCGSKALKDHDLTSKQILVPENVKVNTNSAEEEKETTTTIEMSRTVHEENQDDEILLAESTKKPARGRYSRRGSRRGRGRKSMQTEERPVEPDDSHPGGSKEDELTNDDLKNDDQCYPDRSAEAESQVEKTEDAVDDHKNKNSDDAQAAQEMEVDIKIQEKEAESKTKEIIQEHTSEPERLGRSLRVRAPKRSNEEIESPKAEPVKKQFKRQRATDEHNKSYEAVKKTPTIKLPTRPRATISISDPSTRPDSRYEVYDHDGGSNRKFRCNNCKYSTDRLNNIVFHHKRSNEFVSGVRCPGVLRAAEEQRAEIIRLQQTPKGNKKKALR